MKTIKLLFAIATLLVVAKNGNAQFTAGVSPNTTVLFNSSDDVGIGLSPSWKLDLSGDFNISTGNVFRYNGTPFLVQTTDNLFVGQSAGASTTGQNNSFYGHGTGFSNTVGINNTFIGYKAGFSSTIANGSTFVGAFAGYSANTNIYSRNTFIGYSAGYNVTSGTNNLLIGYEAGLALTTGGRNLYIGNNTGKSDSLSTENTFIGNATGGQSIGNNNSFFGYGTGYTLVGSNNTLMGHSSGVYATGSENTYIGSEAAHTAANSDSNICIGSGTTPNNSSDNNILIGNNTSIPDSSINRAVISHGGTVLCDNCMLLGDTTSQIGGYNVGIGQNAPTHQLQLSTDDAAKPGTATWTIISDMRLKKDIKPYTDGLNTILSINPVWFNYNGKAGTSTNKQYVGVLAQDMQKIAPYTVGKHVYIDPTENKEEYLSFDANSLFYMSINAIKEQQKQIAEKDSRIKELENTVIETNKKLEEIIEILKQNGLTPKTAADAAAEDNTEKAYLKQNTPNPFSTSTKIEFYIPQNTFKATINIFDAEKGILLKSYDVTNTSGNNSVTFQPSEYSTPNTYIYNLVINEVIIDTKKMIRY